MPSGIQEKDLKEMEHISLSPWKTRKVEIGDLFGCFCIVGILNEFAKYADGERIASQNGCDCVRGRGVLSK